MNNVSTRIVWTVSAKRHAREKDYSVEYIEAVVKFPQEITPGRRQDTTTVRYGYGYGAVVALNSTGTTVTIVTCFKDDRVTPALAA